MHMDPLLLAACVNKVMLTLPWSDCLDSVKNLWVKEAQKLSFFQYTDLDVITTAHVDVGHYIYHHYCDKVLFANAD